MKRATEVALSVDYPNLVLVFHLCTNQITNGGRTSAFSSFWLVAQALNGFFLFFNVFGLDRQADYAALTIDADDLGFNFFAFFQNVARVFNAVTADFEAFSAASMPSARVTIAPLASTSFTIPRMMVPLSLTAT